MRDQELAARLALSSLVEPGDERVGQALLSAEAPAVVAALQRKRGGRVGLGGLEDAWSVRDCEAAAEAEIALAAATGVELVIPGDAQWPTQLDDLGLRRPLVLRVDGSVSLRSCAARSVAIVGARSATNYGCRVADELAASMASHGWTVVSGAAFGIDAAAHLGALAARGATIAVTASGADRPTPLAHTELFGRIRSAGAVVSEVPLGSHPTRSRFLIRNRVIAALARAVVVVEAATRSGARSTAREAGLLGRVVAAVPGPVTSAMSLGCHDLIRDSQATLVSSAEDVLELLGPMSTLPTVDPVDLGRRSDCIAVAAALRLDQSRRIDEVAGQADLDPAHTLAVLSLLEQAGRALRDRDGWRGLE